MVTPGVGRRFVLQAECRTRPAFHVCMEAATHQRGCVEDGDGTLKPGHLGGKQVPLVSTQPLNARWKGDPGAQPSRARHSPHTGSRCED